MNFREKIKAVLTSLGLFSIAQENKLSTDDLTKVKESYFNTYGSTFDADLAAQVAEDRTVQEQIVGMIQQDVASNATATAPDTEGATTGADEDGDGTVTTSTTTTLIPGPTAVELVQKLIAENQTLRSENTTLAARALPENPLTIQGMSKISFGGAHSATHAFGIDHPLFEAKKRWNQIAMRKINQSDIERGADDDETAESFKQEVRGYGRSLAQRVQVLHAAGLLSPSAINEGLDYSSLTNAGLGEQYVVRRQDALIARILELPSVNTLFPLRSGVQDQDLITNVFFGEFSQAYQEGEVFKGGYKLEPDKAKVFDVMFKHRFGSMKGLERQYVGYLNTNGSNPVKWNMIEWFLLHIATVLNNERYERAVMGCRVEPIEGEPGHYLNSATGVFYKLMELNERNKLLLVDDVEYSSYTSTSMLDCVEGLVSAIHTVNPELLKGKTIMLNGNHAPWYKANYRTKYGKDMDFAGIALRLANYDLTIEWIPNLGNLPLILIEDLGNLQQCEDVPNEMLQVKFEQRLEIVLAWSNWKEGVNPAYSGREFATRAAMIANNYAHQVIFANKPCVVLADKAVSLDGTKGPWFVTSANTAATAITGIADPRAGIVYKIECGGTANASTIAKAGEFSEITAAWIPTAIGQWIKVVLNPKTSKFREVSRSL